MWYFRNCIFESSSGRGTRFRALLVSRAFSTRARGPSQISEPDAPWWTGQARFRHSPLLKQVRLIFLLYFPTVVFAFTKPKPLIGSRNDSLNNPHIRNSLKGTRNLRCISKHSNRYLLATDESYYNRSLLYIWSRALNWTKYYFAMSYAPVHESRYSFWWVFYILTTKDLNSVYAKM